MGLGPSTVDYAKRLEEQFHFKDVAVCSGNIIEFTTSSKIAIVKSQHGYDVLINGKYGGYNNCGYPEDIKVVTNINGSIHKIDLRRIGRPVPVDVKKKQKVTCMCRLYFCPCWGTYQNRKEYCGLLDHDFEHEFGLIPRYTMVKKI